MSFKLSTEVRFTSFQSGGFITATVVNPPDWKCANYTSAHCSYLDIYISQKIRLCVVDVEVKFQTNLQAKLVNFLVWKFRSIILIFLLFFVGIVKSSAFWTLSMLFQKGWNIWVTFLHQIAILQLFGIAAEVCKKHWIWQLMQKIEEKWV